MVFIKDSKREFLDQVLNKRLLVYVNIDVDALCSWKILQHLLHCENILYTVIPVNSKQTLEDSYNQHRDELKHVILINCGASLDLVDILQPPEDAVFYLIDSLRPIEVHNVYNGVQIKIIVQSSELNSENASVPDFEDIFEENENNDTGSADDDDSEDAAKPVKKGKDWELKRNKILFEYYKYTYHQCSSSLILFDLAWKTAKDNNDLLWWCILGLTEQYVNGKIEFDVYNKYVSELQSHVLRLNHNSNESNDTASSNNLSINCLKISHLNDLNMVLLRHWSIMESIYHSIDLACLFKVWTNKGKKKLNEFLADLGLRITDCKQKYSYMDNITKNDFKKLISSDTIKQKYKYEENQLYLPTFTATFGYCHKFNGFDMVHILQALLENSDASKSLSDKFLDATNCLNRDYLNILEYGLELAITFFKTTFQNIQTMIDMNQIVCAGPFLQVFFEETNGSDLYSRNITTKIFARYLLQSYLALTKGKRVKILPLVISVKIDENVSLIMGIPPHSDTNNVENCFGLAFDEAAEKSKSRVNFNHFDTSTIIIQNEDRSKFMDALVAIMQ